MSCSAEEIAWKLGAAGPDIILEEAAGFGK